MANRTKANRNGDPLNLDERTTRNTKWGVYFIQKETRMTGILVTGNSCAIFETKDEAEEAKAFFDIDGVRGQYDMTVTHFIVAPVVLRWLK